MTDNVIQFPHLKKDSPPQTLDEIVKNVEDLRTAEIERILFDVCPLLFSYLNQTYGIVLPDIEETHRDINLVIDVIRSLLYRKFSLTHPLQEFAQKYEIKKAENLENSVIEEFYAMMEQATNISEYVENDVDPSDDNS